MRSGFPVAHQRTLHNRITVRGVGLHSGRAIEVALLPAAPGKLASYFTGPMPRSRSRPGSATSSRPASPPPWAKAGSRSDWLSTSWPPSTASASTTPASSSMGLRCRSTARPPPSWRPSSAEAVRSRSPPQALLGAQAPRRGRGEDRIARLEPAECSSSTASSTSAPSYRASIASSCSPIARPSRSPGPAPSVSARTWTPTIRPVWPWAAAWTTRWSSTTSRRNPEGLRFPDEFVRHKILDAIGDSALLGAPIVGRYVGRKAGHALNAALVSPPRPAAGLRVGRVPEQEGRSLAGVLRSLAFRLA